MSFSSVPNCQGKSWTFWKFKITKEWQKCEVSICLKKGMLLDYQGFQRILSKKLRLSKIEDCKVMVFQSKNNLSLINAKEVDKALVSASNVEILRRQCCLKRGRYWEVLRNTETAMLGLKRGSCCSPRSEPEATSSLRRSPEERWVKPYLQEFEVETQNEDFIKDGGLLFCEFAQRIQIFVVVQPWLFLSHYCLICILKT